MSVYAVIVGKNGYNISSDNTALLDTVKKYHSTGHTISCVALGPSNYFAVIANSNVKKNSMYLGGEHFMETMQIINKRDVKQISFGLRDQYAITFKNGSCTAYLETNSGALKVANEHCGNIKYMSLCGKANGWIVGYGKNEFCAGESVSKELIGFLDGIQLANKSIKLVEIDDSDHFFVHHSAGFRFNLPHALTQAYQNRVSEFSTISFYSMATSDGLNFERQFASLQARFHVCATQNTLLERKVEEMSGQNAKLEKEINKLKGLDVKAMDLNGLYQLKEIITTSMSRLERVIERKHKNNVLCITCLERKQEIFFEPCHHLLMCQQCSNRLTNNKCPVCQTLITNKLKVFRS